MANDFDEVNPDLIEQEPESRFLRLMSVTIVLFAIVGFFALAWYAYETGTETMDESQVELIKAEEGPVKETPDDPGGQQFPHQDKTVYDAMTGKEPKANVERILPAPEEPMARPTAPVASNETETETWINEKLTKKEAPTEQVAAAPVTPDVPALPMPPQEEKPPFKPEAAIQKPVVTQAESAKAPVVEEVKAEPVKQEKAVVAEKKPEPKKEEAKKEVKIEEKKMAPAAGGNSSIQLGAFQSDEEAAANWKTISGKNGDLLSGRSHQVVKATVPGKGTYYRLRVTELSASEAASLCGSLEKRKQPCYIASK